MENPENDISLFKLVKQGDRHALNILFGNHYQRLCTFAGSLLTRKEEAEEIVSDVFFNLWKNRNQIDIKTNFRSYLYACVRNACLSAQKKTTPFLRTIDHVEIIEKQIADSNPETSFQFEELKQCVGELVVQLPPACRKIFIMSRYDGLKYREISEMLCISEKTVENQLIKALAFLRTNLKYYQEHKIH